MGRSALSTTPASRRSHSVAPPPPNKALQRLSASFWRSPLNAGTLGEQDGMRDFDLVIFDCDGVLVDSEVLTNSVFRDMLVELGAAVTLGDMFERFVGHSMERCLELARDLLGRAPPED